ncbi:XK-related protein 6-like isoform X2 [Paramacrobiotus metropolitanus]|uniref:XK-related protein 6-like isoform X2 n=1 Tax=Paramacrobiotus metropolitanus TaxID=2943436 RepID=UPI0024458159|nr:XK-related protein 6-like isoform X2 [Paramacrobiotus metropolitanus]XP_055347579.1 XK-related protein 6-like isoform X2 [Paramacrobiotus metropolitanus]
MAADTDKPCGTTETVPVIMLTGLPQDNEAAETTFFKALATRATKTWMWAIWGLFSYLLDTASDWYLVIAYFSMQKIVWGCLTLAFIVVPQVIIAAVGILSIQLIDLINTAHKYDVEKAGVETTKPPKKQSQRPGILFYVIYFILHILQFGPVFRYVSYFKFHISLATTDIYSYDALIWVFVNAVTARMRFLESCLEAMPQLLLQMYILITVTLMSTPFTWTSLQGMQVISMSVSLLSGAAGVALVHDDVVIREGRCSNVNGCIPSYETVFRLVHFVGRLFILTARCAVLAATFSWSTVTGFIVCVWHVLLMAVCVYFFNLGSNSASRLFDLHDLPNRPIPRVLRHTYRFVLLPFSYLFDYVDEMDKNEADPKRSSFPVVYYFVHGVENIVLSTIWAKVVGNFDSFSCLVTVAVLMLSASGICAVRIYFYFCRAVR